MWLLRVKGCRKDVSLFLILPFSFRCRFSNTLSRLSAVTTQFSKRLRRLAATDHLVKTAGVTIYAQAVLVPELTVLLVKEDMGVNDETARQILRETIDIGEKLNHVPNDVVPLPEDTENIAEDL